MSQMCEFGTAPDQKKEGFKGIGVVKGTEQEVLDQFFSDDVRLVKGGNIGTSNDIFEFFVMVR